MSIAESLSRIADALETEMRWKLGDMVRYRHTWEESVAEWERRVAADHERLARDKQVKDKNYRGHIERTQAAVAESEERLAAARKQLADFDLHYPEVVAELNRRRAEVVS